MKTAPTKTKPRKAKPSPGILDDYVHGPSDNITSKATSGSLAPSKLIEHVRRGLPVQRLDALRDGLEVPMKTLVSRLGISKATLHRRKTQGRLGPSKSERVVRFARLMRMAAKALGGSDEARQWLNSPQFGLRGAVPLDYAETEIGAREVENLLGRIEYGVYS